MCSDSKGGGGGQENGQKISLLQYKGFFPLTPFMVGKKLEIKAPQIALFCLYLRLALLELGYHPSYDVSCISQV